MVYVIPATTIIGSVIIRVIVPETVIGIKIITIWHSTQTHDFYPRLLQSRCVGSKHMNVIVRAIIIDVVIETDIETSMTIGDCR